MRYGIYYAYWEKQWGVDYLPYIGRAARLGFDILEISCASLAEMPAARQKALKDAADDAGIALTGGYGPRAIENIASADPAIAANCFDFWAKTFPVLRTLGVAQVGGGLYSYWPVDYTKPVDKAADLERSAANMKRLAALAEDYGITLCMEVLNRHEGYLLNTAAEGLAYVEAVGEPNVKVMLDTYHMNFEEDSFEEAIRTAGARLGHVHVGECNRRLPRAEGRMPWASIGKTLRDIEYGGTVVMEPFVLTGGQVGRDIRVWRDLSGGADAEKLDEEARESLAFLKTMFEGGRKE